MTHDVNEWWGVTVIHGEKIGSKQWRARAYAFRRDTQIQVGKEFTAVGTTMGSADKEVSRQATNFARAQGMPGDWKS